MQKSIAVCLMFSLITIGMLGQSPVVLAQTQPGGGTIDLSNSRICPKCGAINAKDVKFCKDCGYNFEAAMKGQTQPKGPKKEPVLSFALSFFLLPGIGQFYNGDGGKGVIQLLLYGGATTLYILEIPSETLGNYWTDSYGNIHYSHSKKGNTALFWTGIGVAGATALWSWIDAPISASRKNKANGYSAQSTPRLNLTVSPEPRNPQKMQVGLVLKKGF